MRKDSAIAAGCLGAGMNLVSLFAPVLGLSASTQRIGFAFGVMLMLLGVALYFRQRQGPAMTTGDTNINYGQQGIGINKGTINVVTPQPAVHATPVVSNEKVDGGYASKVRVVLDVPYAASRVAVKATGSSIKGGSLLSMSGLTYNTAEQVEPEQGIFEAGAPLNGEYLAEVVTEKPDDLSFEVAIQT